MESDTNNVDSASFTAYFWKEVEVDPEATPTLERTVDEPTYHDAIQSISGIATAGTIGLAAIIGASGALASSAIGQCQFASILCLFNMNVSDTLCEYGQSFSSTKIDMRYLDFIGIQSNMYDDTRRNLNSKGYKSLSNINIDSGNFIANYIYLFILYIILGFIHLVVFLLTKLECISKYPEKCISRTMVAIKNAFEFSVYFYLTIVASLFLFLVTLNDVAGGDFSTAFNGISFFVALIVLILLFIMAFVPVILILMSRLTDNNDDRKDKREETDGMPKNQGWFFTRLWITYMSGLRRNIFARVFYSVILAKFFVYACIFILIDDGVSQIVVFVILSALFIAYLVVARPFNHFIPNILVIANEGVIFLVALMMTAFVDNDDQNKGVSDAIISILTISIVLSFIV